MPSPLNQSVAWRSPAVGIIPPNSSATVYFQLPFDLNTESPLVLTFNGKNILKLRDVRAEQVTIDNLSAKSIPYVMVIVPRMALTFQGMDWKRRIQVVVQKLFPNLPTF